MGVNNEDGVLGVRQGRKRAFGRGVIRHIRDADVPVVGGRGEGGGVGSGDVIVKMGMQCIKVEIKIY